MASLPLDMFDVSSRFPGAIHIKSGGQKAVYRYVHPSHGDVVLKFCPVSSPGDLARIEREVELLRDIVSDYYPKHIAFEKLGRQQFLIIEEFLEGKSLAEALLDFDTPQKALDVTTELIQGLRLLWDRNVVHRDLKPANIIISDSGTPRIIDLGIARLIDGTSLTKSIALMGPCTPFFAAPEQLTNSKANIDFRADQFSLGILLFLMVTNGKHPFDPEHVGRGDSIIDNILSGRHAERLLDGGNLNHLKPLFLKLLGREPYQRFRTVHIFQDYILNVAKSFP